DALSTTSTSPPCARASRTAPSTAAGSTSARLCVQMTMVAAAIVTPRAARVSSRRARGWAVRAAEHASGSRGRGAARTRQRRRGEVGADVVDRADDVDGADARERRDVRRQRAADDPDANGTADARQHVVDEEADGVAVRGVAEVPDEEQLGLRGGGGNEWL